MLSKFNKKKSYQGYTIIEILLVLVLILIFFSALIFNFISLDKRNNLSDGTLNTQTIFRIVKSQSEMSGKTFRIKFIKIIGGDEGDILKEKYKELPLLMGKADDEAKSTMSVWLNPFDNDWTIVATNKDISCVVGLGTDMKIIPTKKGTSI